MSADAKLMGCPLLSDHLLLTCLGQSLVQLNLTVYSDDPSYDAFDMDRLSGMSRLQYLHIESDEQNCPRVWRTRGLLSSLTALERFSFHPLDGFLQGLVVPALGSVNNLTALTTTHIPEGYVEVCSAHFPGLRKFSIKYNSLEQYRTADIAFAQSMSSLCKLSLHDCRITSRPLHLKCLSCLTKVKFDHCEFTFHDWLAEALEGATQVHKLKLENMYLTDVPYSVCRMIELRQLDMPYSQLSDLPADLAQLTNLEILSLIDNELSSVPIVLEQMTHLKELILSFPGDLQLSRPLTFLSAFASLSSFCICQHQERWNSLSQFHIGQLHAMLSQRFRHRSPTDRPEFCTDSKSSGSQQHCCSANI